MPSNWKDARRAKSRTFQRAGQKATSTRSRRSCSSFCTTSRHTPPSMCWASFSASVRGMPTTMWRTSCRSCCGACRTLAYCLSGRLELPMSLSISLINIATLPSTGWSAPASGRRIRNSRRPVTAEKKRHTLQALVLTTLHRQILSIFCVFAGSIHDYRLMKKVFDPKLKWFYQVNVWLDLGFQGVETDYGAKSKINLPHKRPRKSKNNPKPKLTAAQTKHNRQHARTRFAVEHAIGGMKAFHCLTHSIRNHLESLIEYLFWIPAGLWNLKIA